MPPFSSRRRFLAWAAAGLLPAGCGTILHPERRGQPAGALDWKVVALDAIGLIFFFIPGVIAFAVDFNNGTIYLPPSPGVTRATPSTKPRLVSVRIPRGELTKERIEQVASAHVSRPVQLDSGNYRHTPLESTDHFWDALAQMSPAPLG